MNTSVNSISPDYFKVMGIPLIAGRVFREAESSEQGKVNSVIVNEAFVRKFLNRQNPLGRQFSQGKQFQKPQYEIVGVVGDTKYRSLREVPPPIFYTCGFGPNGYPDTFILHVRTQGDPHPVLLALQKLVHSIDSAVPLFQVATLQEEVERSLWQEHLLTMLASGFGAFALLLSGVGLYGILAYFVTQRYREIGLRMALGAQVGQVIWFVIKRIVPILSTGLLVGVALSFWEGTWIQSLLYGVQPIDSWSTTGTLLLLLMIGIAGAAVPTMRAVGVDPSSSLRDE